MDRREWFACRFEEHRPHLIGVAYRILGSVAEADDAVQEAWLRTCDVDPESIENIRQWLTTVVGRVCLNALRVRRSRPEQSWAHVPDPVVELDDKIAPEENAVLADSVGLALMVVLDELTPSERVALVLHDMFAVPFIDIAALLDRQPAATRQLASRARRRIRNYAPPDASLPRQRSLVEAFFAASRDGDFDALLRILDPEVVLRIDGGASRAASSTVLHGATAVARHTRTYAKLHPFVEPALVNGAAGAVIVPQGEPFAVMAFTVKHDNIVAIDALLDPDRIARLQLPPRGRGANHE